LLYSYYLAISSVSESGMNTKPNSNSYELASTDKLASPMINDELLAQEVLAKAGPAYTYQRKDYSHDIGSLQQAQQHQHHSSLESSYRSEFISQNRPINNADAKEGFEYENAKIIKIDPPPPLYPQSSVINQDPDPIRIVKPNTQNIVYKQQVYVD
jgi:hypothetical protein